MSADGSAIRVLHVDDEADFSELVQAFLQREDDRISVLRGESVEEGLELLEGNDVVEDTINDVASVLTTEDVREKVLEISETDISAEEAAREYLTDNDIL
jgi:DNA-binding NtrC family response regulator